MILSEACKSLEVVDARSIVLENVLLLRQIHSVIVLFYFQVCSHTHQITGPAADSDLEDITQLPVYIA